MQLALSTYQNRGNFHLSSVKSVSNVCSNLELSNHLGNVLSVISDKVIPHNNAGVVDYYMADVQQAQDYSPFGVTLKGRSLKKTGISDLARYGFNGMEKDDEMKGEGNSYDFGARMYDSRLGRFLSLDRYQTKFPENSPYSFAGNSPILNIDQNGDYSVAAHYIMTYKIMLKLGYSMKNARRIAHYASVYADHADYTYAKGFLLSENRKEMLKAGLNPKRLNYNSKEYGSYEATKNSQGDLDVRMVSIHAMRTYWEDIEPEEAVKRALYGGEFLNKDENGIESTIFIEGAYNVLNRLSSIPIEKMTEAQQKEMGVALHTIQDAQVHNGARWVSDHEDDADKLGHSNGHPNIGCVVFQSNIVKAYAETSRVLKKQTRTSPISSVIQSIKKVARSIRNHKNHFENKF